MSNNQKYVPPKINVKQVFMKYHDSIDNDFQKEVKKIVIDSKELAKNNKSQIEELFEKTTFNKMITSSEDDFVDIVYEENAEFWANKSKNEILADLKKEQINIINVADLKQLDWDITDITAIEEFEFKIVPIYSDVNVPKHNEKTKKLYTSKSKYVSAYI